MQEQIELQINVNIGNNKHLIRVPKNVQLSSFIGHFLAQKQLNPKYQTTILQMVELKLKEQSQEKRQESYHEEDVPKAFTQNSFSAMYSPENSDQLNQSPQQSVKSSLKNQLLSKIRNQLENIKEKHEDTQAVYEKWKIKEKQKQKKGKSSIPQCEQSRQPQPRQTLSPDHFYKKGLQFKSENAHNIEEEFKKQYPFKLHEQSMSLTNQKELTNRLAQKKKDGYIKQYLSKQAEIERSRSKSSSHKDVVKSRLRKKDKEVDRVIYEMIREGDLSHVKHKAKSKSPFRATTVKLI